MGGSLSRTDTDGHGQARTRKTVLAMLRHMRAWTALFLTLALPAAAQTGEVLEIVESAPVETVLDHPDLRDAWQVWPEMIGRAQKTLDFAEFYASADPASPPGHTSRLETVVQAVEHAAERGVRIRFLAEKVFQKTYPEILAR